MIHVKTDQLEFSFPKVHAEARLRIEFQRTLRIPDDDRDYPLPAGLGRFPLKTVDEFASSAPPDWREHGGVMLPMYQSEAMWINFHGPGYPFVVKIAAGKINAVTGKPWGEGLEADPQNYMVVPGQPWLDGFCVAKGVIRQFVAMPLGSGYSAEEQLTGKAEFGGLQIVVSPMKPELYEKMRSRPTILRHSCLGEALCIARAAGPDMGLAPGGRMRQEIFEDPHGLEAFDLQHSSRCFVHLANALVWRAVTGEQPPAVPPTGREYANAGLPWFAYYGADTPALEGSSILARLKSVLRLGKEKGDVSLPENDPVKVEKVITLGQKLEAGQVREGNF